MESPSPQPSRRTAVITGAGPSGLTAACELLTIGPVDRAALRAATVIRG